MNKNGLNDEEEKFQEWYKKNNKALDKFFNNVNSNIDNLFKEPEKLKEVFKESIDGVCNNNLVYRSDEKYTRIEKYEDYEFTHCIAFEMAIRNIHVKRLKKSLEKLNYLSKNIFDNFSNELSYEEKINNFENIKNNLISFKNILTSNISLERTLEEIMKILAINLSNNQIKNINEDFINIILNKKKYYLSIINVYNNSNLGTLTSKYKESDLQELFKKANLIDKIILIELLKNSIQCKLEYEYYVVNEKTSITPENIEEFIDKDTNHEPSIEINNHIYNVFRQPNYIQNYTNSKGYIFYQGLYKGDNSFTINKVIPNFEQPLRMFNTMEISINPSLPLNDILSFVKKIKEDYDTDESLKSFFDLVSEDFNSIDQNTTIDKKISLTKKKWADIFYIYDYFKFYLLNKNKINKGKNENGKENKEDNLTTIAKEISLQLSYYHKLSHSEPLDFSKSDNLGNYNSAYNEYETNFEFKMGENNFYITADHIKRDYYKKIKNLIEGRNPKYKKLIDGKNHNLNSFINGKNNVTSKL